MNHWRRPRPGPRRAPRQGGAAAGVSPPIAPAAARRPAAGRRPPKSCRHDAGLSPVVRCDDRGVVVTRPRWMWRDCCRVLTVAGRGGHRQARLNPARVRAMLPGNLSGGHSERRTAAAVFLADQRAVRRP